MSWKVAGTAVLVVVLGGWFVQQSLGAASPAPRIDRQAGLGASYVGGAPAAGREPARAAATPHAGASPVPDHGRCGGSSQRQGSPGSRDDETDRRGDADGNAVGDHTDRERANDACDDIEDVGPGPSPVRADDADDSDDADDDDGDGSADDDADDD